MGIEIDLIEFYSNSLFENPDKTFKIGREIIFDYPSLPLPEIKELLYGLVRNFTDFRRECEGEPVAHFCKVARAILANAIDYFDRDHAYSTGQVAGYARACEDIRKILMQAKSDKDYNPIEALVDMACGPIPDLDA